VFKKGVVEISFLFLCPELTGAIQVDNVWLSFSFNRDPHGGDSVWLYPLSQTLLT
jgi:hypothetical protein